MVNDLPEGSEFVSRREVRGSTVLDLVIRQDSADETKAEFIVSTAAEDRVGDIVEQNWRLKNYRRNPVVLLEHRPAQLVGRGSVKLVDDETHGRHLRAVATWDIGDHNPQAALVAIQHARGIRNAVSVGFRPEKSISRLDLDSEDPRAVKDIPFWRAGFVHKAPELLEFSSVAIPAHPDALQLRSWYESDSGNPDQLRSYLRELAPQAQAERLFDHAKSDPAVFAALKALITPPEPPDFLESLGI